MPKYAGVVSKATEQFCKKAFAYEAPAPGHSPEHSRQHFVFKITEEQRETMSGRGLALLKTLIFTLFVPGSVTVVLPYYFVFGGRTFENGLFRFAGILPVVCGVGVYLSCAWNFAFVGQGTPAIIDPPKQLVSGALYRLVRNPMYIGVEFIVLGEAILFESIKLLAYAFLLAMMFHLFVVYYEEPTLKKRFGAAYEDYSKAVPRWIPRVRRRRGLGDFRVGDP